MCLMANVLVEYVYVLVMIMSLAKMDELIKIFF